MKWSGHSKTVIALWTALIWASLAGATAQTSDLVIRSELRICADPGNMPFSNRQGQGFENQIAEFLGKTLDIPVTYYWFPQSIGFIRNTLRAKRCDLVIGYAQGHELVQNTNHYYSSAYVLITRDKSTLADVETLSDPRLRGRKIGVIAGTPPATHMTKYGLIQQARSFQLNVDRRFYSPAEDMVKQVADGKLDAGVLWGPIGGYYASKIGGLKLIPLIKEIGAPRMIYRITMGVRPLEQKWKRQLNRLLRKHRADITAILQEYSVPLVDP